jgi:NAD(P) transhydrogenase subunit alpha
VASGVTIAGRSEYPAAMSSDASKMFGNNVVNLLRIMTDGKGNVNPDFTDEIVAGTAAVHGGEYLSPRVKQLLDI